MSELPSLVFGGEMLHRRKFQSALCGHTDMLLRPHGVTTWSSALSKIWQIKQSTHSKAIGVTGDEISDQIVWCQQLKCEDGILIICTVIWAWIHEDLEMLQRNINGEGEFGILSDNMISLLPRWKCFMTQRKSNETLENTAWRKGTRLINENLGSQTYLELKVKGVWISVHTLATGGRYCYDWRLTWPSYILN